ncbi:MAG: hypothetical protein K5900_05930 [Butyrivibrio sp.]|nr:hypothetical protein [Butyrivibrio sp.]
MARDLSFWKEKNSSGVKASDTYHALINGEKLDYVYELSTTKILSDVKNAFCDWKQIDTYNYEKDGAAIEIFASNQICRFDCYNLTEKDMNKIIDIMLKYDCPLYDAAIDVRFS